MISPSSFGANHFFSTIIGGGYTFADSSNKRLSTLHNFTSLRIGIDPQMKEPLFWGVDLESFRIQRNPEQLLETHHYGEGGQLIIGFQVPRYQIWIGSGFGRMRVLEFDEDSFTDMDRRYKTYSSTVGGGYSIYQREYAKVDIQTQLKILTTERAWRQRYRYKHLRFFSILLALTIIDI